MRNNKSTNYARLAVGLLIILGVAGDMISAQARAGNTAPIPPRKPELTRPAKTAKTSAAPAPKLHTVEYPEKALSAADAKIYKAVFAYQEQGKFTAADRQLSRLHDHRLMGHILYQRYMHPDYKADFAELRDWMTLYKDHPGGDKIHRMANGRMPEGHKGRIEQPVSAEIIGPHREPTMIIGKTYVSPRKRTGEESKTVEKARNDILSLSNDYEATAALDKLHQKAKLFDTVEYDHIQAKIAASYLYSGNSKRAGELAAASLKRSGAKVPLAGWIAGLSAWEAGNYKRAAKAFEIPARSEYASGWTAAASSYWAARAHMRAGNVRAVSPWLQAAMQHPRTFYGLIATRSLGRDFDFNWKVPTFTRGYYEILMNTNSGNRAIALVAAGQPQLAEAELIRMKPESDEMRDALLAYSGYANLPSLGMRLASLVSDEAGAYYDAALYPTGPYKPQDGYKIDPALIYAITRQESRFDPNAKSGSGAVGLMQILPSTAESIVEDTTLTNPEQNIEVAQQYLENLLKDRSVKGDMVMLLVAYNAGPGNLAKWRKQWPEVNDPLLFIELMPSSETRTYVERVLANFWIYCLRDGQPTPTLDALATGKAAKYARVTPEPAPEKQLSLASAE